MITTLRNKREIQGIFREKARLDFEDFFIVYKKNELGQPRFLFVASKRNFKKAVERNRAKRLLRQAVRSVLRDYKNLGYDILIVAKKSLIEKKIYDIIPQIRNVFESLKFNAYQNSNIYS